MNSLFEQFDWLDQLFRYSYISELIHYEVGNQLDEHSILNGDFILGEGFIFGELLLNEVWILK